MLQVIASSYSIQLSTDFLADFNEQIDAAGNQNIQQI